MNRSNSESKPASEVPCLGTIFVIDDEPMLLELAVMILTPLGYRISTFRSAEAALAVYTQLAEPPLLIVTDYAMHEMTGMTLIEKCRILYPKQKTILVSGTVDERIYINSECKPDRFLAKPYSGKLFLRTVNDLLKGSRRRAS